MSQVQGAHPLFIPALGRHKQVGPWEFEASLGSIDKHCFKRKEKAGHGGIYL